MKEDCGQVYKVINEGSRTIMILMVVILFLYIAKLLLYCKKSHQDIKSFLKCDKIKIICYFVIFISLIGTYFYTSIKTNDYKNRTECVKYY